MSPQRLSAEFVPKLEDTVNFGRFNVEIHRPEADALHSWEGLQPYPDGQVTRVYEAREAGQCGGVKAANYGLKGLQADLNTNFGPGVPLKVNVVPTNGADATQELLEMGAELNVPFDSLQRGDFAAIGAHGNPRDLKIAKERGATVHDATCLYVHKTHAEIERAAQAVQRDGIPTGIVYLSVDGKPDHPERLGSTGLMQDLGLPHVAVENEARFLELLEQEAFAGWERVRVVSQTTNHDQEAARLAELIGSTLEEKGIDTSTLPYNASDVCRTVTLRQQATRSMVDKGVETMVVVGSVKSKNTKNLGAVAIDQVGKLVAAREDPQLRRIVYVNAHSQLPNDISGSVGVVTGASTLEANIAGVVRKLNGPESILVGESDAERLGMEVFRPIKHSRDPQLKTAQERLGEVISRVAGEVSVELAARRHG